MLFQIHPVPKHGVHKIMPAIQYFFEKSVDEQRFVVSRLFPDYFQPVLEDSAKITSLFRKVFSKLPKDKNERAKIRDIFLQNNKIEDLCDDTTTLITKFEDLPLRTELKSLFKYLYDKGLKLKSVKQATGDINTHYCEYLRQCRGKLCPICSLWSCPDNLIQ